MTTTAAVALATAISFGAPAYALPLPGSNADAGMIINQSTPGPVMTYTGENLTSTLATTAQLNFTSGLINITQLPPTYTPPGGSTNPNTFVSNVGSPGNQLTTGTADGNIASTLNVNFTTGLFTPDNIPNFLKLPGTNGTYIFNATGIEILNRSNTGNVGSLSLDLLGTLHDTSGSYADTAASLGFSLNQSGNGNSAISTALTLTSPASFTPNVPEPASLSLLGVGLIGLGAVRRRFAKR